MSAGIRCLSALRRSRGIELIRAGAAAVALLIGAHTAHAVAKTLTFSDGVCQYRVRYDPARVEGARLEATFAYLADTASSTELPPSGEVSAADAKDYSARCIAHRQKLEATRLVALPGLDELRRRDLSEVEASCGIGEAKLAAARGDAGPMRAYAPACLRWADLLALPAPQLKRRWNDLVVDLCATSTERTICAGQLQRDGEGPGSEERRRDAVLSRWSECASPREDASSDRERERLKTIVMKRFGAKALSCAR